MVTEAPAVELHPELDEADDDLDHLVCCRDDWQTALCGADVSKAPIVLFTDNICEPCLLEVDAFLQRRGAIEPVEGECFKDGTKCPDEDHVLMAVLNRPEGL